MFRNDLRVKTLSQEPYTHLRKYTYYTRGRFKYFSFIYLFIFFLSNDDRHA